MPMNTSTLTIRLPQEQRATLREAAKRLRKSESELIRDLLEREFEQTPFGERAADFMGCLASTRTAAAKPVSFRDTIGRNNRRKP